MPACYQIPSFATVEDVVDELAPGYPVYCLRPAELKRQAAYFLDNLPGRVMYAVRCNPYLPAPFRLPVDIDEGDWIEIGQTGAYSSSAAIRFNGSYPETFVAVDAPSLLSWPAGPRL